MLQRKTAIRKSKDSVLHIAGELPHTESIGHAAAGKEHGIRNNGWDSGLRNNGGDSAATDTPRLHICLRYNGYGYEGDDGAKDE